MTVLSLHTTMFYNNMSCTEGILLTVVLGIPYSVMLRSGSAPAQLPGKHLTRLVEECPSPQEVLNR